MNLIEAEEVDALVGVVWKDWEDWKQSMFFFFSDLVWFLVNCLQ
jgi:hypothetical protein